MSRTQFPSAPNNLSYDFSVLDYGQGDDMPGHQPMDDIDSSNTMALLDNGNSNNNNNNNPLFGPGLVNFPMWTDPTTGASFGAGFPTTSFSTPMSHSMGPMMASGPPPASLYTPQPLVSQRPYAQDTAVPPQAPVPANAAGGTSSSATDFTKRRNWSEKVIEEMKDLFQVLDDHGRIKYVSRSVTGLVGYLPEDVNNVFLRDLIHPDDVGLFVSEMNEAIASGGSMRLIYRLKKKDGAYAILESVGHAHVSPAHLAPTPSSRSHFCQAVFLISRPYPTKNAGLLDTFLGHKVENERLRRRIAALRAEEEAEEVDTRGRWEQRRESEAEALLSNDVRTRGSSSTTPASAGLPGVALTRENLEGAVAEARPDSLSDKLARYERDSRAETIEMLTGLRYVDGKRGGGSTSGRTSPKLITGDAGIMIPMGRELRRGEKKKKQKAVEEYVCTDCGTLESPEWRKGPNGPKTLCNACGLRWAKKEKKRQLMNSNTTPHSSTSGDQPMGG